MSQHDFDFAEVLRRMVEARASDVHITTGFPPAIRDIAMKQGMKPLRIDGLDKVKQGMTSIAEVARVA